MPQNNYVGLCCANVAVGIATVIDMCNIKLCSTLNKNRMRNLQLHVQSLPADLTQTSVLEHWYVPSSQLDFPGPAPANENWLPAKQPIAA